MPDEHLRRLCTMLPRPLSCCANNAVTHLPAPGPVVRAVHKQQRGARAGHAARGGQVQQLQRHAIGQHVAALPHEPAAYSSSIGLRMVWEVAAQRASPAGRQAQSAYPTSAAAVAAHCTGVRPAVGQDCRPLRAARFDLERTCADVRNGAAALGTLWATAPARAAPTEAAHCIAPAVIAAIAV